MGRDVAERVKSKETWRGRLSLASFGCSGLWVVDGGFLRQAWWLGACPEPLGVSRVSGIEGLLTLIPDQLRGAVVDTDRGVQPDA